MNSNHSQHQKTDKEQPRPFAVSHEFQPAPPRPVRATDVVANTSGEPWPFALGHDKPAPQHEQADAPIENEPFVEPSEQPRPSMSEHGEAPFADAVGHGQEDGVAPIVEPLAPDEPTWRVAVEESSEKSQPVEVVGEQVETSAVKAPPESADLVTVEEAVEIFRERGLPRHMRTIQKYCSRKTGRVLESYQVPTENGIRYMIERSSIDRFIGDAAMQAPTGNLENETIAQPTNREVVSTPVIDQLDIFEHPLVKRLEGQVERLESRNETLQANIQNVLEQANERLVELQKAAAVAQSESLGKFLLESERIRGGQEKKPPLSVNRGDDQFADFSV